MPELKKEKKNESEKRAEILREIGPFLHIGWQIAITIGLGVWFGSWLDEKYDSSPLYLLIFSIVGIGIALYNFFKIVFSLNKKNTKRKK